MILRTLSLILRAQNTFFSLSLSALTAILAHIWKSFLKKRIFCLKGKEEKREKNHESLNLPWIIKINNVFSRVLNTFVNMFVFFAIFIISSFFMLNDFAAAGEKKGLLSIFNLVIWNPMDRSLSYFLDYD